MHFKQPEDTRAYREAKFDPSQHKELASYGAFEREMRKAAGRDAIPID